MYSRRLLACSSLCFGLFLLMLCPMRAAAEVQWRNSYGQARQEALEKDRPLILDFGTENCFWCKQLDFRTFRDPSVIGMLNDRFIPLKIDAEQEPSLTSALNIQSYPTIVIASPSGKILGVQNGFLEAAQFQVFLQRALAKIAPAPKTSVAGATPASPSSPSPSPAEPEWMTQDYQFAAQAITEAKYVRAITLLKEILKEDRKLPVQIKARKLLTDLEQQAADRLALARDLEQTGRFAEAIESLRELVGTFQGTRAAEDGTSVLTSVLDRLDDKTKERMSLARQLLGQARSDFQTREFLACLDRCESLMTEFGDLPESAEANRLANLIKSNPVWMQKVCDTLPERHGKLYLAMAETKLKEGQPQQAVFYLERIVRAFPNTRHAELAQVRLSQIQGPPTVGVEKKGLSEPRQ